MSYLTKAKAALILDQPFFASLLLNMPIVEDKSVKTLATDGDRILYNPDFMAKLSLPETVFVMAHETMHCVFQHMFRRGTKNHNKYNIAADYVINDLLVKEKIGVMPDGCLLDANLVKAGNYTTEGVYALLPDSDENKGAGDAGGALDDVNDAANDQAGMAQKEAEMKVRVIQAANAAKMSGKLSQGIERLVKNMVATKTDWKSILRRFLSERAKTDLSYAKPKRRFMADDINLPSLIGEKMGGVVVAIDCSGSVDDKLLEVFSNEINKIVSDVIPAMTHVVYFDSKVLRQDSFSPDDSVKISACGGGGTAFSPIFEHIDANDLQPVACIVLTDLQCNDFGSPPGYPVLWASTLEGTAPFGEIVLIKE
jgi:predicted metal-dependent peptidase